VLDVLAAAGNFGAAPAAARMSGRWDGGVSGPIRLVFDFGDRLDKLQLVGLIVVSD
jgi:hypothetical protein